MDNNLYEIIKKTAKDTIIFSTVDIIKNISFGENVIDSSDIFIYVFVDGVFRIFDIYLDAGRLSLFSNRNVDTETTRFIFLISGVTLVNYFTEKNEKILDSLATIALSEPVNLIVNNILE